MSSLTGKCDLYDHISMEKMVPSPTNPNVLVSDFGECFEIFKKRTKGVIWRQLKVLVTPQNKESVAQRIPYFKIIKQEKKEYYTYLGKTFKTLKSLNNYGVWIDFKIEFNTILDILPYLSYIIAVSCSDDEGEKIILSSCSYEDDQLRFFILHNSIEEAERYYNSKTKWKNEAIKREILPFVDKETN